MRGLLFPLGFVAAIAGMLLNLRYLKVLMDADLNEAGRRRLEGVPTDLTALINSGEPAIRVLRMLFTREYAGFGNDEVTRAGDTARRGMFVCLPLVLIGMFAG